MLSSKPVCNINVLIPVLQRCLHPLPRALPSEPSLCHLSVWHLDGLWGKFFKGWFVQHFFFFCSRSVARPVFIQDVTMRRYLGCLLWSERNPALYLTNINISFLLVSTWKCENFVQCVCEFCTKNAYKSWRDDMKVHILFKRKPVVLFIVRGQEPPIVFFFHSGSL